MNHVCFSSCLLRPFIFWLKFPHCSFFTSTRPSVLQLKSGQITAGGKRSLSEKIHSQIFAGRDKKDRWRQDRREGGEKEREDGKWGHVSEGAERRARRWWRRWISNLRGEMNGKGSCGETGEENGTRRWLGGGKKTVGRCGGMREKERVIMNHVSERCIVPSLPSLSFCTAERFLLFSTFAHIFLTFSLPSLSRYTPTCTRKNTHKPIRPPKIIQHTHAQKHTHGWVTELKRVFIAAAAASPFISL